MIFKNRRWNIFYAVAFFGGVGFLLFVSLLGWFIANEPDVIDCDYPEAPIEDVALPTDIVEYHFVDDREEPSNHFETGLKPHRPQPLPNYWNTPHPNAKVFPSGIAILNLSESSSGATPSKTDSVLVHYIGWKTDGTEIDSSYKRNQPATFKLTRVIPGFTEALQNVRVGEKIRVWIPEDLAYKGRRGLEGTLIFDIELLSIPSHLTVGGYQQTDQQILLD